MTHALSAEQNGKRLPVTRNDRQRRSLNGSWVAILTSEPVTTSIFCDRPDARCREYVITGVDGEGTYGSIWGEQEGLSGPADTTLSGDVVRIVTPTHARVDVRRNVDGLLSGTLATRDGETVLITLRKVASSSQSKGFSEAKPSAP